MKDEKYVFLKTVDWEHTGIVEVRVCLFVNFQTGFSFRMWQKQV